MFIYATPADRHPWQFLFLREIYLNIGTNKICLG